MKFQNVLSPDTSESDEYDANKWECGLCGKIVDEDIMYYMETPYNNVFNVCIACACGKTLDEIESDYLAENSGGR